MQEDFFLTLHILKLVLGGFSAFFAILLWSKTRDFVFMSLIIAVLSMYAGIVYETLVDMGIIINQGFLLLGSPFFTLFFTVVPFIFLLISLIVLFVKLNK